MVLDNGDNWTVEDFQAQVAEDIFKGTPEVWMIVPEGNAKTTLMAGVGLYYADYMPTAEILLAASAREQAEVLYTQAEGFVERSPGFDKRFRAYPGYRRVKALRSGSRLQVRAADDRTGDGVIFDLAFLDELHRHRDLKLYRTWRGKLLKRNGQLVAISTAGEPASEFEDARAAMLRGAVTITRDGFHTRAESEDAVLHDWSVPADADAGDMDLVKLANPLSTVTPRELAKKRRTATMTDAHWRRFVCNQAVRTESTAIDPMEWAAAKGDDIPEGEPVDVGLDLGWKHDTTAWVPLWMPDRERRVFGVPEVLVPPRDGTSLKPAQQREAFKRINDRNPVRRVVMDEDRGAEVKAWLEDEMGVEVATYPQQGIPMVLAYERFMEGLRNGWIEHPGDETFTEHVLNAIAKTASDGRTRFERPNPSRSASEQRRRVIDALIAAAIVHSSAVADEVDSPIPAFEVLI